MSFFPSQWMRVSRTGVTRTSSTRSVRLQIEGLEDRCVPAILTVNSLSDAIDHSGGDSVLTLREAIAVVNAQSTAGLNAAELAQIDTGTALGTNDTIQFAAALTAAGDVTITLTNFDTGLDATEFGPTAFIISRALTIQGPSGANGITIARDAAAANFRLFHVQAAGNLTLDRLTLSGGIARGGNGSGGGGGAAGMGGAIFNQGSLTLSNSLLTNNQAIGGTGGINSSLGGGGGVGGDGAAAGGSPNAGGGFGGGGNSGPSFGDPGGSSGPGGDGGFGGGGGGGGFFGGTGGRGGFGGGGAAGDNGGSGGGFGGGNASSSGGGGGAGMGGAVFNQGGFVAIVNSTLSANSATGGAGGFNNPGQGLGGAIFTRNGVTSFNANTFNGNTANQGGGAVYAVSDSNSGAGFSGGNVALTLSNSILANTVGIATDFASATLGSGVNTFAGGGNLIERNSGFTGGIVTAADPQLGPLQDNGGPTKTHALAGASPAVNAGSRVFYPQYTTRTDNIPAGSASVSVQAGKLQLRNRGHLNTAPSFDPSSGGLIIRGTWTFDGTDADFLQILTRSDGAPNSGNFGETANGIEFQVNAQSDTLQIIGRGGASFATGTVAFPGGIKPNTAYHFRIDDNGSGLSFTLTDASNSALTANVTGNSLFQSATNLITFHNREFGGGIADATHDALLDNLAITNAFGTVLLSSDDFGALLPAIDQRGGLRFFNNLDIGAVEFVPLVVDTTADVDDGNYSAGNLSLREAIVLSNANPGPDTITFAPALTAAGPATILLTDNLPAFADNVNLTGPGAKLLSIDGANAFSLILNNFGVTSSVSRLTLTRGFGLNGGGAANLGTLTLSACAITANAATASTASNGGGVENNQGTLTILNSTISGNAASQVGGGVNNFQGIVEIVNSTISGNTANGSGGGVLNNGGTLKLIQVTVTGNRSDFENNGVGEGGGLSTTAASTETLNNTIIAGNFKGAGTTANEIAYFSGIPGAIDTANNNLIGDAATAGGLTHGTNGNIVGNNGTGTLAPASIVGPLADNGGPTKTHALVQNSLALGKGSDSVPGFVRYDQREAARDPGTPDIGAYEVQHPLSPVGVPSDAARTFAPHPHPNANTAFVTGLYQSTLLRAPEPAGLAAWLAVLNNGTMNRAQVAIGFVNSFENRANQVTFFYKYFLNRTPDDVGRNAWVNLLQTGTPEVTVITGFILSPEFTGQNNNASFVNLMYYALLSRDAEPAGFNGWKNALDTNALSRAQVVTGFLGAPENNLRIVNANFLSYLKRRATPAEINGFTSFIVAGNTIGSMTAALLASDEFFALAAANL